MYLKGEKIAVLAAKQRYPRLPVSNNRSEIPAKKRQVAGVTSTLSAPKSSRENIRGEAQPGRCGGPNGSDPPIVRRSGHQL
jgi:hypothetical protein